MKMLKQLVVAACCLGLASSSHAGISFGGSLSGNPVGTVTGGPINTINPSFNFSGVNVYGNMTVSFGSRFQGQALGSMMNSLSDTTPTNMVLAGPNVMSMLDIANIASGTVIGGATNFGTPIAILFSDVVSGVAFDLGHLDPGSTIVEAFDANGDSLGTYTPDSGGHQNIVINSDCGNIIQGISIYVPEDGMDWEGFAVDNLSFTVDEETNPDPDLDPDPDPDPPIEGMPEPATAVVWGVLAMLAGVWSYSRGIRAS